ncbi:MAG TPA: hypothetical protein VG755_19230 [Nannocystaceae bacterium]|nr:hypothetical protein [Nannocystaceae bacterium]
MSAWFAHPLGCAALLFAAWWIADRVWTGVWSPERFLLRRRDIDRFRARLAHNPGDRDARHRLAAALLERGGNREALSLLEQNLADGENDAETLALAGNALLARRDAASCDRGVELLERARAAASRVALPGIDLTMARGFADHRRWSDARAALLRFLDARPGSIEGHARLARAHERLGDEAAAADARRRGWIGWREQPPFQRRFDRPWAWRLRPAFAAAHVGAAAAGAIVLGWALSRIELPRMPTPNDAAVVFGDEELEEQGWRVPRITPSPSPDRFVRTDAQRDDRPAMLLRTRADLDNDLAIDMLHKLAVGDFACRLPLELGAPADDNGIDAWTFDDRETGARIHVQLDYVSVLYFVDAHDAATAQQSLFAFEQMIEDQPLRDCELRVREPAGEVIGVRNGKPFGGETEWD